MKPLKRNTVMSVTMAVIALTILLENAVTVYADQVDLPYTFSPGTTISSSQVNSNFQALAQSMPGAKVAIGSGSVTLSTQWQNLTSITVTPPADGMLMLISSALVAISQGSTAGGNSSGYSNMGLCVTQTSGTGGGPNCTGGGGLVTFETLPTDFSALYGPRLTLPITNIAIIPVVKNTPVTYYLTAAKDSFSVGSCVINTSSLAAIFLPGGYLQ